MALKLDPAEIGLSPGSGRQVWGLVMDTPMSDARWYCLAVFADGTTSIYSSAAFGIIGAGAHERVRAASEALLAVTEQHLNLFTPSTDTEIPPLGTVTIRALTFDGPKVVTAGENDLGQRRHPASQVFHAAHEVISQARQVTP